MLFLPPAALRELDHDALAALIARDECVIAAGSGELRGVAAAAFLFADYAVLDREATLWIDTAEALQALAGKGRRVALRLYVAGRKSLSAIEAQREGVCDEIIDVAADEWLARWKGKRSEAALDAAAVLIRSRGGDEKEREVFAALFASGEPQKGMRAFLDRKL